MIGLIATYVLKNLKEPVKRELLRTGIILTFEGLGVLIRYFALNVWGKSFIGGWWGGRERSLGNIGEGVMFNNSIRTQLLD